MAKAKKSPMMMYEMKDNAMDNKMRVTEKSKKDMKMDAKAVNSKKAASKKKK